MLRRHSPTIAVCAVCAISVLANAWIAWQSTRQLDRLIAASDEIPMEVHDWNPDESWYAVDRHFADLAPPRLLTAATFEEEGQTSSDENGPADALHSRCAPPSGTSALETKSLSPRRQQELAAVREVIEDEMPETSAEERDIWFEELKSLPAEVVRDLLQVRKQLRVLTPDHHLSGPGQLSHGAVGQLPAEPEITAEPVVQSRPRHADDWASTREALEQAMAWSNHNLANAATPGYKRIEVLLGDQYDESGFEQNPLSARGCGVNSLRLDVKQGLLAATERPLDFAIQGDGYFLLTDPATGQQLYTRCGHFTRSEGSPLTWRHGDRELELQPRIAIPAEAHSLHLQPDGTLAALLTGQPEAVKLGQLELARFADPSRLLPAGEGLYVAPLDMQPVRSIPSSLGMGAVQQSALEESNVDIEWEQAHREFLQSLLKTLPAAGAPRTAREPSRSPN